jgi:hypothetical protein
MWSITEENVFITIFKLESLNKTGLLRMNPFTCTQGSIITSLHICRLVYFLLQFFTIFSFLVHYRIECLYVGII